MIFKKILIFLKLFSRLLYLMSIASKTAVKNSGGKQSVDRKDEKEWKLS